MRRPLDVVALLQSKTGRKSPKRGSRK
jgi:hypothetical protein